MASGKKVLIVEDSTLLSRVLKDSFSNVRNLEVCGVGVNSREAWNLFLKTKPDVVTLDLMLPDGSGFDLLERIMKTRPTPVVIISSLTNDSARETFRAFEMGAADVIEKPKNILDPKSKMVLSRMGMRVLRASEANTEVLSRIALSQVGEPVESVKKKMEGKPARSVYLIASSTGGPHTLSKMMPLFGDIADSAIVIVQHIPHYFSSSLAQRLDRLCPFKVKEAENDDVLTGGTCLLAPGGVHLEASLERNGQIRVKTKNGPMVKGVRPSADVTFSSFSKIPDIPKVCIVLTGMGNDGLEGARMLKNGGSRIISQNRESCVVYGMPKAVEDAGLSDSILPFEEIPESAKRMLDKV
jgi:two-component system chemotaxis response regulator CheB